MKRYYTEWYRSGHNEPHSKCGCPPGHVCSNPTHSANLVNPVCSEHHLDFLHTYNDMIRSPKVLFHCFDTTNCSVPAELPQ